MPRLTTPADRLIFPHPQLWLPTMRFSRRRCCCGGAGTCAFCTAAAPDAFAVAPIGIVNQNCPQCGDLNATVESPFIVARHPDAVHFGYNWAPACLWVYEAPGLICRGTIPPDTFYCADTLTTGGFQGIALLIYEKTVEAHWIAFCDPSHGWNVDIVFKKTYGSNQDCSAFDEEEIPWSSTIDPYSRGLCDASAGYFLITAL